MVEVRDAICFLQTRCGVASQFCFCKQNPTLDEAVNRLKSLQVIS